MGMPRKKRQKEKSASRFEGGALGRYFGVVEFLGHYRPIAAVLYDHKERGLTHTEVRDLSSGSNGQTEYALYLGIDAGVVRREGTHSKGKKYRMTSYGRRIMDYLLAFKDED